MRICLVGATHPCHNPRLLREADTLAEAGHEVRVVTPSFMPELAFRDQRQIARRKWRLEQVDYRPVGGVRKIRSTLIRGRRRLAEAVYQKISRLQVAQYAYTAALPELVSLAAREHADWFIAHAHAALPVAAAAARRWQARLGFDCEDLLAESGSDPVTIVRQIEKTYLQVCDYISVPSHCIAARLKHDYRIADPIVLYNVFPAELAEGMLPPQQRAPSKKLQLHWFSQTIGPGRGIEDAIEAAGMLGPRAELHLRGNPSKGYQETIYQLARQHGTALQLHPQVDHDDLIKTMAHFDVGLALERPENGNYARTVTNKVFSYLLAGLAIAATDTQGQREVLSQVPSAGFLYPANDSRSLADGIKGWLADPGALRTAQQAAWTAAREKFCWDVEQHKLLRILHSVPCERVCN